MEGGGETADDRNSSSSQAFFFFFYLGHITVESGAGLVQVNKRQWMIEKRLNWWSGNISNAHCSDKSVKFGRKLSACARTQLEVSSGVVSGAADNGSAGKVKKSCQNGRDG